MWKFSPYSNVLKYPPPCIDRTETKQTATNLILGFWVKLSHSSDGNTKQENFMGVRWCLQMRFQPLNRTRFYGSF